MAISVMPLPDAKPPVVSISTTANKSAFGAFIGLDKSTKPSTDAVLSLDKNNKIQKNIVRIFEALIEPRFEKIIALKENDIKNEYKEMEQYFETCVTQ